LCNLCGYDEYRKIILGALNIKDILIKYDDIQTQQVIPNKMKIPDIIIENDKIKIIIENKINRNYRLLKSQTATYPNFLSKSDKQIKLIYLVPENYIDKQKIIELSGKFNFISIVYWEHLIEELEQYNKDKRSEIIYESIQYFVKILKMIPKTIFTEEDLLFMNNIANFRNEVNAMAKEAELFLNVILKIRENLKLNFSRVEPRLVVDPDAFGYYFCQDRCFLGYSFTFLDSEKPEETEYVLSLAVHNEGVNSKIKSFEKYPPNFDGEWYYFKFDGSLFINDEKEKLLSDYCEEILKNVLKK
jgi:hypothetical protein